MKMTKKEAEAFEWAVISHAGQKYGEMPYFTHLLDVRGNLPDTAAQSTRIAAILHDIVEDTAVTRREVAVKFGETVATVVDLVTKDENLSYMENIQRIIDSGNKGAMQVKLADNYANQAGDKSHMKEARRKRLTDKYNMSIRMLREALYG